jgi:hypothetical protein
VASVGQNVYNLSELTESQARELVQGPVCVRFFHRVTGTVVTRKCPPMVAAARRRLAALAACLLPLAVAFWGGVAWLHQAVTGAPPQRQLMGAISVVPPRPPPPRALMGEPAPLEHHLMGKPVAPKARR